MLNVPEYAIDSPTAKTEPTDSCTLQNIEALSNIEQLPYLITPYDVETLYDQHLVKPVLDLVSLMDTTTKDIPTHLKSYGSADSAIEKYIANHSYPAFPTPIAPNSTSTLFNFQGDAALALLEIRY